MMNAHQRLGPRPLLLRLRNRLSIQTLPEKAPEHRRSPIRRCACLRLPVPELSFKLMDDSSHSTASALNAALTLVGAAVGGAIGHVAFGWLVRQGLYAPAIPGVLLGVGGGLLAKQRSLPLALVCGVLAIVLCLVAEWRHFPFVRDASAPYFLSHLADLKPLTLIMIAVGGFTGFWFVWRARPAQQSKPPNPIPPSNS